MYKKWLFWLCAMSQGRTEKMFSVGVGDRRKNIFSSFYATHNKKRKLKEEAETRLCVHKKKIFFIFFF
jgi:hypothetical protein